LFYCLVLFSCDFGTSVNHSQNNNNNQSDIDDEITENFLENEYLFEENENNEVLLIVTDEKFWTSQGCTVWKLLEEKPAIAELPFEVNIKKTSGTAEAGYGIIFGVTESNNFTNMLVFLININGEYAIGELKENVFYYLQYWTYSEQLIQGYDEINSLKIVLQNKKHYALYINNSLINYIYSPGYSGHLQGKNGLIAVISPKDRLPDESVNVVYTIE
jgi:hypothetical protein